MVRWMWVVIVNFRMSNMELNVRIGDTDVADVVSWERLDIDGGLDN